MRIGNPYPHRYKYGKQTKPIDFTVFKEAMEHGKFSTQNRQRNRSFLSFLYWFGTRKSEVLELTPANFKIKHGILRVMVPAKKGGSRTEPLEIPVDYPYVGLIIDQVERTQPKQRVWPFSGFAAWRIVKWAMGDRYYPHFFRLNRATHFLEDPTTTIPEMKAWFGWKSTETIDAYIGYSGRHIRKQRERLAQEFEELDT
jgi:Site-specific recombinase XerD